MMWNVIRPGLSTQTIGWGTSVMLHVTGGLAAWMMVGAAPTTNPNLAGHTGGVKLIATWQEPMEQLQQLDQAVTIGATVLIMPREARIAERTFVHTDTDVSQPSPEELALVERLLALPPPAAGRRATQPEPERSALGSDVSPPRQVPRRSPPAPKIPAAHASVPSSAPENPSVATDVESIPHLLKNVPPTYPAQALVNRWEGTVLLRLHIAADGGVTNVELISSSGRRILDVEAMRTVRHWRFVPGQRDGQPVAATVRLPVQFVLDAD